MSYLLKITPGREVESIEWNEDQDSLPQLYRALSSDEITVDMVEIAPHQRGHHISVWADEDGLAHRAPLNFYGSAYAGTALVGTIVVTAFDPETGDTMGLSEDQLREEEDHLIKAVAGAIARAGALSALTGN